MTLSLWLFPLLTPWLKASLLLTKAYSNNSESPTRVSLSTSRLVHLWTCRKLFLLRTLLKLFKVLLRESKSHCRFLLRRRSFRTWRTYLRWLLSTTRLREEARKIKLDSYSLCSTVSALPSRLKISLKWSLLISLLNSPLMSSSIKSSQRPTRRKSSNRFPWLRTSFHSSKPTDNRLFPSSLSSPIFWLKSPSTLPTCLLHGTSWLIDWLIDFIHSFI